MRDLSSHAASSLRMQSTPCPGFILRHVGHNNVSILFGYMKHHHHGCSTPCPGFILKHVGHNNLSINS